MKKRILVNKLLKENLKESSIKVGEKDYDNRLRKRVTDLRRAGELAKEYAEKAREEGNDELAQQLDLKVEEIEKLLDNLTVDTVELEDESGEVTQEPFEQETASEDETETDQITDDNEDNGEETSDEVEETDNEIESESSDVESETDEESNHNNTKSDQDEDSNIETSGKEPEGEIDSDNSKNDIETDTSEETSKKSDNKDSEDDEEGDSEIDDTEDGDDTEDNNSEEKSETENTKTEGDGEEEEENDETEDTSSKGKKGKGEGSADEEEGESEDDEEEDSEESETEDDPVEDPFADEEDLPDLSKLSGNGMQEPREATLKDIIKQLKGLDPESKRGAIAALKDLLNKRKPKNESLTEALKGVREMTDDEFGDYINSVYDLIDQVEQLEYEDEKAIRDKKTKVGQ
jgi:hypothetical protein